MCKKTDLFRVKLRQQKFFIYLFFYFFIIIIRLKHIVIALVYTDYNNDKQLANALVASK